LWIDLRAWRPLRLLDRRGLRPRADGHRLARRQGHHLYRLDRRRLVRRGQRAQERSAPFRLYENSAAFNRFLVTQLNERLGQFIGLVEYGRTLDATARLARSIASLFNPILYPDLNRHLEITQEEIGALSGISRQNANQCLKRLEREGLLRLEYGGVTIVELDRLRSYGD
jgi:CRP-like cAMP-binding protein